MSRSLSSKRDTMRYISIDFLGKPEGGEIKSSAQNDLSPDVAILSLSPATKTKELHR